MKSKQVHNIPTWFVWFIWCFLALFGVGLPLTFVIGDFYLLATGSENPILCFLVVAGCIWVLYEVVPTVVRHPPWKFSVSSGRNS